MEHAGGTPQWLCDEAKTLELPHCPGTLFPTPPPLSLPPSTSNHPQTPKHSALDSLSRPVPLKALLSSVTFQTPIHPMSALSHRDPWAAPLPHPGWHSPSSGYFHPAYAGLPSMLNHRRSRSHAKMKEMNITSTVVGDPRHFSTTTSESRTGK